MLRLSNYIIFTDLNDGDVLLVHGYSGAWDLVSKDLALSLQSYGRGDKFTPLDGGNWTYEIAADRQVSSLSGQLIELFIRRGYLTDLSAEAEQELVSSTAARLHSIAKRESPSYVFTLSYNCNLRCAYCFQDNLRSDPANAERLIVMSPGMADRIFEAMPQIEAKQSPSGAGKAEQDKARRITLFGGEPLLKRHRPIVEHIVKRARENEFSSLSAITNGTELQHFTDLIGKDGISFLQITFDGAPDEHNRRRVGLSKIPTFDLIADNIDLALSLGTQIKLRINVDRENVQTLPELADIIVSRGWSENALFSSYATPVHESAGNEHESCGFGSWTLSKTISELKQTHPNLAVISGSDTPLQRRIQDILRGDSDPLLSFQPTYCGAHTSVWVFDALGDIYTCWERAGDVSARVGRLSLKGDLSFDESRLNLWRGRSVSSNPTCRRCPFAFYCGGGCALLAEMKNGAFNSNYCDNFAKRFRTIAVDELRRVQREQVSAKLGSILNN